MACGLTSELVANPRTYLRCLACGKSSTRAAFLDGAFQRHVPAILKQEFIGCGAGVDGAGNIPEDSRGRPLRGRRRGGLRWTKSRPSKVQLEIIAAATIAAAERLHGHLGGELPDVDPAALLVSLTDDELVAYLDDTQREQAERESMIAEEMRRRMGAR